MSDVSKNVSIVCDLMDNMIYSIKSGYLDEMMQEKLLMQMLKKIGSGKNLKDVAKELIEMNMSGKVEKLKNKMMEMKKEKVEEVIEDKKEIMKSDVLQDLLYSNDEDAY